MNPRLAKRAGTQATRALYAGCCIPFHAHGRHDLTKRTTLKPLLDRVHFSALTRSSRSRTISWMDAYCFETGSFAINDSSMRRKPTRCAATGSYPLRRVDCQGAAVSGPVGGLGAAENGCGTQSGEQNPAITTRSSTWWVPPDRTEILVAVDWLDGCVGR